MVLLGMGILGEYLARIHEEVRGRPRYLIHDQVNAPVAPALASVELPLVSLAERSHDLAAQH
jgi:hypothetical protein